jgi:hypothetical protein
MTATISEDDGIVARDGLVGRVAGHQPDAAVDPLQDLDRRRAVPLSLSWAATISPFSATSWLRITTGSPSAIAAPGHRVSPDVENEQRPVADQSI